jgi:DNA-binding protein YbaB
MFSKLKAIKDLRSQAKKLEQMLEGIVVEGQSKGLVIRLNGKQEVLQVDVPTDLPNAEVGEAVKRAFRDALQALQGKVQAAMKESGGLPDMSQLLGSDTHA